MDPHHTRRGVLKGALGLTCGTCAVSGVEGSVESTTGQGDESVGPEWSVLDVENYPFSIRYRTGYRSDAEQAREWAIFAYESVQVVYSHELSEPITFDLYPADEYQRSHGNMVYSENTLSASMVTPSEYDGGYSNKQLFYRHGVTHEYVHATQKNVLDFHTHANWMMEGFAEAVAVYHTDDQIYESYHENHRRARATRRDIERGFGHVLGVNEYVYRGSMQLLKFMFEEYGTQAVGEIFEQDAESMTEAMQMRLDITPIDLEASWLAYAQREIGGDYTEEIERLGGTVTAFLRLDSLQTFEQGSITVKKAVYQDDDYMLVVYDEGMNPIGRSESFAAGTRSSDIRIPIENDIAQPHPITVRLHHADQSSAGDPVTVNGSHVERAAIYNTSQAAIRFSTPPSPADTSVVVNVFVAESYETGKNDVMLRIMDGDSSSLSDVIGRENLSPGESAGGLRVTLDESAPSVPLSDGQTITANLIDDRNDNTMAQSVHTVGESASANDQQTQTQQTTSGVQRETTTPQTETSSSTATGDTQQTTSGEQQGETTPQQTSSTTTTGDTQQAQVENSQSGGATSGSGPGLGVLSALTGIAGLGYFRKSTTDDPDS